MAPRVEIVTADHLNKADVGAGIVRRWLDEDGVAAVIDVPNLTVALAINQILRDKDRAFIASSVASSDLTGKFCVPTTVQWTMDTWALANGTAKTMVKQHGDTWFFLTADYAFGHALVARCLGAGAGEWRQGSGRGLHCVGYRRTFPRRC